LITASLWGDAGRERLNSLGGRIFDKDELIFRENPMKTSTVFSILLPHANYLARRADVAASGLTWLSDNA
jgi:hypothetical protein